MISLTRRSILASLILCLGTLVAAAQVNVYVDARNGNDANLASTDSPVRSISQAVHLADALTARGVAANVLISPGTYREQITINRSSSTARMTLKPSSAGAVIVSGSDVYYNWAQSGNIFYHSFAGINRYWPPVSWALGYVNPLMWRTEMIFVNGALLRQVLHSYQLVPGTFYVDDSAHQLNVYPAAGMNMYTALVEVAMRAHTLVSNGRSNLTIAGMQFQHATSEFDDNSVNINGGSNILIDSITAKWNNFGGMRLAGTNTTTVQNSVLSHNGGVGMNASRTKNGLFSFNETDLNNWRGSWVGFYNWAMGGFKLFQAHGNRVIGHHAYNNVAQGLWFDTDARDNLVDGAVLVGNYYTNLQLELSYGPNTVQNSVLCYGGQTGINLINIDQTTLNGLTLYGNGGNASRNSPQIYLQGAAGGRHFTDWETHVYRNVISQRLTLINTALTDTQAGQTAFQSYFTGSPWYTFRNSLRESGNSYIDSHNTTLWYLAAGGRLNLAGWQRASFQDQDASFGSFLPHAAPAACTVPSSI